MSKLRKRKREQLPVMLHFAGQIEDELNSADFDEPLDLAMTVEQARASAVTLRRWLDELCFLAAE